MSSIEKKIIELEEFYKQNLVNSKIDKVNLNNDLLKSINGKRWILEVYKEYYWKCNDWEIELDNAFREFQVKDPDQRYTKLPHSEAEKLPGYLTAKENNRSYRKINDVLEYILLNAAKAILNIDEIKQRQRRVGRIKAKEQIFLQKNLAKHDNENMSFLEDLIRDISSTTLEIMNKQIDTTITRRFLEFYDRKRNNVIKLFHFYQPEQFYKFYLRIREKKNYNLTHYFENKIGKSDESFDQQIWKKIFQERYNELMSFFPDKNPEKQKEQKEAIALIKELLLELKDGDEVQLGKAIVIVRKEGNFDFLTDEFIEESLKQVAKKSPVFEYVRLKECIRIKSSPLESLGKELDNIFDEWLSDIEEGKELCMICMKPVIGEKVIFRHVFLEYLQKYISLLERDKILFKGR